MSIIWLLVLNLIWRRKAFKWYYERIMSICRLMRAAIKLFLNFDNFHEQFSIFSVLKAKEREILMLHHRHFCLYWSIHANVKKASMGKFLLCQLRVHPLSLFVLSSYVVVKILENVFLYSIMRHLFYRYNLIRNVSSYALLMDFFYHIMD
jgi:hypothetical protein